VLKVYTWVRNRIWITGGFAQTFAGKDGANFIYNGEQRKLFDGPDAYLTHRKAGRRRAEPPLCIHHQRLRGTKGG
jgi:hypothetical protein